MHVLQQYVILKDLTENPEPTWRAMEKLYEDKKVHAIGVSNWSRTDYIKPNIIKIHTTLFTYDGSASQNSDIF